MLKHNLLDLQRQQFALLRLRHASRAIEDAVDEIVEQAPELFGLEFIGDGFGSFLMFVDEAGGFLEDAGSLVELTDTADSFASHAVVAVDEI